MKRVLLILALVVVILFIILVIWWPFNSGNGKPTVNVRLQWIPQSQFAGFIVAKSKGYYDDEGLNVKLHPAGPDLKPHVTVAAGTDDIGIGVPNQVIAARSNGVPLIAIAQVFQDSPNRYVLKKENQITDLRDLKGKKVGLWLGGDESEFVSMLGTVGMKLSDVKVIPQQFSVVPFLEGKYILSQVTSYNELNLLRQKGLTDDKLQILSPKDYNSAILGDVVFTTETYLKNHPERLQKFLSASLRGWDFCVEQPDEALKIVLSYNTELKEENQKLQMREVIRLVTTGAAATKGLGFISAADYKTAERVLFQSKQIEKRVDPDDAFTLSVWNSVSENHKKLKQ